MIISTLTLVATCGLLSWLAGVGFYLAGQKRPALSMPLSIRPLLKTLSWSLLAMAFTLAIWQTSWEVGLFLQLFCASLLMLFSLFVASRWPNLHFWSTPAALALLLLLMGKIMWSSLR